MGLRRLFCGSPSRRPGDGLSPCRRRLPWTLRWDSSPAAPALAALSPKGRTVPQVFRSSCTVRGPQGPEDCSAKCSSCCEVGCWSWSSGGLLSSQVPGFALAPQMPYGASFACACPSQSFSNSWCLHILGFLNSFIVLPIPGFCKLVLSINFPSHRPWSVSGASGGADLCGCRARIPPQRNPFSAHSTLVLSTLLPQAVRLG